MGLRWWIILLPSAVFVLLIRAAGANTPSTIFAVYDPSKQELRVKVEHYVANRFGHYVSRASVYKNGDQVGSKEFEFQTSRRNQTIPPFKFSAVPGDSVRLVVECNESGYVAKDIIIEATDDNGG